MVVWVTVHYRWQLHFEARFSFGALGTALRHLLPSQVLPGLFMKVMKIVTMIVRTVRTERTVTMTRVHFSRSTRSSAI